MEEFRRLLLGEIPRLRRYARGLVGRSDPSLADDLVQMSLERALVKSHLFERGTDLRAWLFTILHNQRVNLIRRAARERGTISIDDVAPVLASPSNQGKRLELRDLDCVIRRLPEEQRSIVLLIGLEGLRYEEVASILAIPTGTVRSRLSRARQTLRTLIDGGRHDRNDTTSTEILHTGRRSADATAGNELL